MIKTLKYYAVNWVDGMKITKDHLNQQENFMMDTVRDANSLSLTDFNFGLLPLERPVGDHRKIFEVRETPAEGVVLKIKECSAITPSGLRIDVIDFKKNIRDLIQKTSSDQPMDEGDYFILAFVDPFNKEAFGPVNPEEIPPRHPFTRSTYNVQLVSDRVFNYKYAGGDYVILGKVEVKQDVIGLKEGFIPPCTTVRSYEELERYYASYQGLWGGLAKDAVTIIKKAAHKDQNSELARNVKAMCRAILENVSDHYFEFKNMLPTMPPVFMIDVFSQLALKLFYETQKIPAAELEEMMNYCFEWSSIPQHQLMGLLKQNAEVNYEHHDTAPAMKGIEEMLSTLKQIFGQLSALDYIGQHKDNVIVNVQEIKSNNDPKAGWSVVD